MFEGKTVETTQLQTLVMVAQTQSFSKAAEELKVTQSAISQSVKNLETKLGVRLFTRNGKRVVLTLEGEKLFDISKKFLLSIEDTISEIRNDKKGMSGGVRVGTLQGFSKSWVFDLNLSFCKEFPEVSLHYKSASSPTELIEDFERFLYDIIIVPESDIPTSGEKVRLTDEYITLVLPKNSPHFKIEGKIDVKQLEKLPLILFERGDSLFRHWCQEILGEVPSTINKRMSVNSHGGMLKAVSEGLGIAVLPTHVLDRYPNNSDVETLGKEYQVFYKRTYLVYHKETNDLLRIKTLIDKIISFHNK